MVSKWVVARLPVVGLLAVAPVVHRAVAHLAAVSLAVHQAVALQAVALQAAIRLREDFQNKHLSLTEWNSPEITPLSD